MRKQYEMTQRQMNEILDASKPIPAIMLQCGPVSTPQANANRAWAALGETMGFKPMTVERVSGRSPRVFSAESIEAKAEK